ncbi:MAG: hypothetical protein IKD55_11740 [Sediminibacterium sp.]|nr:hypothetical protein [Sediminibacterium sp.]MBX9779559.1 hypothetical protein [Chitinophagaceae bacterium]
MQKVVIHCLKKDETIWQGLLANKQVDLTFAEHKSFPLDADLYIDSLFERDHNFFEVITDKPVLVNALAITGFTLPENHCRFNGWPGFYEKNGIEIAGTPTQLKLMAETLDLLHIPYQKSTDVPGMLAARVVAMIINEAYFGWGEGISSKEDIDTAMKLGTNYPFGPFEWASKIGVHKIVELLYILSEKDDRYIPAKALVEESAKSK